MDILKVALAVLVCAIFSIVLRLWRRKDLHEKASKFPGPPALPFIGNAHLLTGNNEEIFNRLFQLSKSFQSPYRLWVGNQLTIVINTPEHLKTVLLSPKSIDKGPFYDLVRPWLGNGLLSAPAQKWRVYRRLMQPTFSTKILQSFVETFYKRSLQMADKLEEHLDGPEFEIYNYTAQCTLQTVCETTMGVDLGVRTISNGYYAEAIQKVVAGMCRRAISPWLHPDFIFKRTKLGRDQENYIKFLHNFTDNVIKTKKKELLEQNQRTEEDTGDQIQRKKVLLDHLMDIASEGKILSDVEVREEVDTLMVAGSDTTAITLSFVTLMLASHPEVQNKVYEELREIIEGYEIEDRHITPEHLARMTYLESVIKETLRLFPISPTLTRLVTEDLQIGDHTLPAGSLALLMLIETQRNGEIWPDPLNFDPERFSPKETEKRDAYTYLPFSGGPKSCIGAKYAMMSMKTLLATILRRYILKKDHIVPVGDVRFKWEFLLRPVDPITIRIERRRQSIIGSV